MINEKRKFSIVCILIFAAICCFLKYTTWGEIVRDGFWAEISPDNTYTIQVSGLPTRLSSSSYYTTFKRDSYNLAPVGNDVNNDSLLMSFGAKDENFKNSKLIATTTVKLLISDSVLKEARDNGSAEAIQHSGTESKFLDAKQILEGFYNGLSWNEIGYKSKYPIEVKLPNDKELLNIVIPQIYAILDDDNYLEAEDYENLKPIVDAIVEKASKYTSDNIAVTNYQIALFVELDDDFRASYNQFSASIVEPSKTILIPVYINWNDSKFDAFVDRMIEKNSKNMAIKLGCRTIDGSLVNSEKLNYMSLVKIDENINFRKD